MKGQRARLSEEQFARIARLVHDRCGFELRAEQRAALERHLGERMAETGQGSIDRYLADLAAESAADHEFRHLVEGVLVQETFFFRTPAHFHVLRNRLVGELLARDSFRRAARPFRLWSAGCATGPEAYSAAIALRESPAGEQFAVIATDISARALEEARQGVYAGRCIRTVPPESLSQHFSAQGEAWRVRDPVRAHVQFRQHNLASDPYPEDLDVIFCRNVLIYFPADVRARIVRGFHGVLSAGGAIFLGHSETLSDFGDLFERTWIDRTVVFRKRAPAGAPAPAPSAPAPVSAQRESSRWRPLGVARTPAPEPERPPAQVLVIEGPLDDSHAEDHAERLKQQVIACLEVRPPRVILDLRKVPFLDAAGVRLLGRTARLVQDHGGRSCFVCDAPVRRRLEREDEILELYDTLQEAQKAIEK